MLDIRDYLLFGVIYKVYADDLKCYINAHDDEDCRLLQAADGVNALGDR